MNIEIPIQKALWKCVFKCRPGVPAHDPLIDLAKEDVGIVKAEIEHQVCPYSLLANRILTSHWIEILSVLSTPATNPADEKSGFNFDERFSSSLSRRRSNQTPTRTPKKERPTFLSTSSSYTDCGDAIERSPAAATDDFNPKLADMKLNMASEKLRQLKIRKDDEIEDK